MSRSRRHRALNDLSRLDVSMYSHELVQAEMNSDVEIPWLMVSREARDENNDMISLFVEEFHRRTNKASRHLGNDTTSGLTVVEFVWIGMILLIGLRLPVEHVREGVDMVSASLEGSISGGAGSSTVPAILDREDESGSPRPHLHPLLPPATVPSDSLLSALFLSSDNIDDEENISKYGPPLPFYDPTEGIEVAEVTEAQQKLIGRIVGLPNIIGHASEEEDSDALEETGTRTSPRIARRIG